MTPWYLDIKSASEFALFLEECERHNVELVSVEDLPHTIKIEHNVITIPCTFAYRVYFASETDLIAAKIIS